MTTKVKILAMVLMISCNTKKADQNNNASAGNETIIETPNYNKCEPHFPQITYIEKWKSWIMKSDTPVDLFDSIEDYMEEDEKHTIIINEDSSNIKIEIESMGGNITFLEYCQQVFETKKTFTIISKTEKNPEYTDSEIHIGTIVDNQFQDQTSKYFTSADPLNFFEDIEVKNWMNEYPLIDLSYEYDLADQTIIVTPVKKFSLTCNEKGEVNNQYSDMDVDPKDICQMWEQFNDTPLKYKWDGEQFSKI